MIVVQMYFLICDTSYECKHMQVELYSSLLTRTYQQQTKQERFTYEYNGTVARWLAGRYHTHQSVAYGRRFQNIYVLCNLDVLVNGLTLKYIHDRHESPLLEDVTIGPLA